MRTGKGLRRIQPGGGSDAGRRLAAAADLARHLRAALICGTLVAAALAVPPVAASDTCPVFVPCTDPRGCPDLVVDPAPLSQWSSSRQRFRSNDCSVVEGEVQAGWRLLARFTTTTPNLGPGDLFVGDPQSHPEWYDLETCHGHEHLKEYSDYRLWTPAGYERWRALRAADPSACARDLLRTHADLVSEMVAGRKQGFCVIDIIPSPVPCHAPADPPKYGFCSYQGISVCWADIYDEFLDGQWIDITYVPGGDYILEVEVNAERFFEELDYANNASAVPVTVDNPDLEICDGTDNDNNGGIDDTDLDEDGYLLCVNDCNDRNPNVFPGAIEVCNGIDDDCDTAVDESTADLDLDGVGDLCDNCPALANPGQADQDRDAQGDACDVDDGLLWFIETTSSLLGWQVDNVYETYNLYRGDLAVLRATGQYTQDPESTPGAAQMCVLLGSRVLNEFVPPPGGVAFYLVTGKAAGLESSLGISSAGAERENSWPCR